MNYPNLDRIQSQTQAQKEAFNEGYRGIGFEEAKNRLEFIFAHYPEVEPSFSPEEFKAQYKNDPMGYAYALERLKLQKQEAYIADCLEQKLINEYEADFLLRSWQEGFASMWN